MRRLMDMISELVSGDPRVLIGLGVILTIVVVGIITARATRAKRMRSQARFVRKRD